MPAPDVDLRGLRCRGADCPDRTRLVPDEQSRWVRCLACGTRATATDLFRPYSARTGQWLLGTGVALSVGFTHAAGPLKWLLLAAGAVELAIAAHRIVYQTRTLRLVGRSLPMDD